MKFLHSMMRVYDLDKSLDFFMNKLGLKEVRRRDSEKGRYTLVFLDTGLDGAQIELTYNWDEKQEYSNARNFGHLAFEVDNIYEKCQFLMDNGVTILRPPKDGRMAFIKSPDNISIELLQKGNALEIKEPWSSMINTGTW
jgi:lactoylglutathione lyase